MSVARPFPFERLPKIAARDVAALRQAARRAPLALVPSILDAVGVTAGASVSLEPGPPERCSAADLPACLAEPLVAAIVAAPGLGPMVALEIEPRLASLAIDRALGGDGSTAPLDPTTLTDVERGVLAFLVGRGVAVSGGAVRLVSIVTTSSAVQHALGDGELTCWPATLRLGTDAGVVRAWVPDALGARPGLPEAGPLATVLGDLNGVVSAAIGHAWLPARELGSVDVGDVVLLDACTARFEAGAWRGSIEVRLHGAHARWRCAIEADGAWVISELVRAATPRPEDGAMKVEEGTRSNAILGFAADAPLEVVVELARFEVPLGELAALRPGEVLATGKALGERVTLRAGGRAIATGELVDVDGELGVRVLAILS